MIKNFKSKSIEIKEIVCSENVKFYGYNIITTEDEKVVIFKQNKLTSIELDNLLENENTMEVLLEDGEYVRYSDSTK